MESIHLDHKHPPPLQSTGYSNGISVSVVVTTGRVPVVHAMFKQRLDCPDKPGNDDVEDSVSVERTQP